MFRFFSSNQPYILFFVPLLAAALLLPIGLGPTPTVFYQQTVFISDIFVALSKSNWVVYLISFFILSVNSVLIHQLTDKQSIFVKSNHITSVIYILLITISPKISGLLQLHISSFFILLVLIRISHLYMVEKPYSILFDCGLLLSLSSLFYLPSGFLLIWICITTLIFKPITWRDFFIPIVGFTTPYLFYYFFSFLFRPIYRFIHSIGIIFQHPYCSLYFRYYFFRIYFRFNCRSIAYVFYERTKKIGKSKKSISLLPLVIHYYNTFNSIL